MSFDNNINKCTFETTKDSFQPQYWKRCYTCWPQEDKGACLECISVCHNGHTVDVNVRHGNFYCDCGSDHTNCKLKTGGSIFRPIPTPGPLFPRGGGHGGGIFRPPSPSPEARPFFPLQPQHPRPEPHAPPHQPRFIDPPDQYGRFPVSMCTDSLTDGIRLFHNSTPSVSNHPTPSKSKSPELPSSESPTGLY